MATVTTIQKFDETRPHVCYRPPRPPTWAGPVAVYILATPANVAPPGSGTVAQFGGDCFFIARAQGRMFKAWLPAAHVAQQCEILSGDAEAPLTDSSDATAVALAFDRAVRMLGWTKTVFNP